MYGSCEAASSPKIATMRSHRTAGTITPDILAALSRILVFGLHAMRIKRSITTMSVAKRSFCGEYPTKTGCRDHNSGESLHAVPISTRLIHQQAEVALRNFRTSCTGRQPFSVDDSLGWNLRAVGAGVLGARSVPRPCEFQMALLRVDPEVPAPA